METVSYRGANPGHSPSWKLAQETQLVAKRTQPGKRRGWDKLSVPRSVQAGVVVFTLSALSAATETLHAQANDNGQAAPAVIECRDGSTSWPLSTAVLHRAAQLDRQSNGRATKLLRRFHASIQKALAADTSLPVPVEIVADDGSLTLEWRLPDRRLGFSLETSAGDSGWYAVDLRSGQMRRDDGDLVTFAPEREVSALIRRTA